MKIDVIMPKMGESLQEGTILKWLKKEGELVERDEMILEISTDKVDTEVPAPAAGYLVKIFAQENETVDVGSIIAEINTDANTSTATVNTTETTKVIEVKPEPVAQEVVPEKAPAPVSAADNNLIDVIMPKMGESLQEGTILKWLKKPGDMIERDEMILEISTDKVDTEVPSPVAGTLYKILAQENETVDVGSVIAKISTGAVASVPTVETAPVSQPKVVAEQKSVTVSVSTSEMTIPDGPVEIPKSDNGQFFSPLVRSIAEAEGVNLNELKSIKGSGVDGRVNKADLLNYIEHRKQSKVATSTPAPVLKEVPVQTQVPVAKPAQAPPTQQAHPVVFGPDTEIIPMDRVRQLIAEHMSYSKHTSAHVTSVAEVDVTGLVKFREKFKNEFEKKEGFKLTFTPFFVKAVIDGVRAFPRINVSVDGKNIILHKRTHLSFATALADGNLIVPVIKNSDALSLTGLARSVFDLSTRARTKKLNPDDIQGGTITLTNVGTFGTLFGTPVINQPQCAIIGVGAIKKRPVVKEVDGEDVIVVRHIMFTSITYDHRVIDGQLAGQALAAIVKSLENMNESTLTF